MTLGGVAYDFVDPQSLDYRELLALSADGTNGKLIQSLQRIVADGRADDFLANKLPPFKLTKLFDAYMAHYGLNVPEAAGSPPS